MTITTLPAPATTLRERMIEDMNLHRLCQTTQRNYLRDVERANRRGILTPDRHPTLTPSVGDNSGLSR